VKENLFLPGSLVKIKPGEEFLILWPTYKTDSYEKVYAKELGRVFINDIMMVIKTIKGTQKKNKRVSDEWTKGSYRVLTSSGIIGWVGEGWVIPAI